MTDIDHTELQKLFTWVDAIPLSRPRRSFTRDFSDGVLVSEIVDFYLPRLVDLHNYSPANSTKQKMNNWQLLNTKVLKKLNFHIPTEVLMPIAQCRPGAVEVVLINLRLKLDAFFIKHKGHGLEEYEAQHQEKMVQVGQHDDEQGGDEGGLYQYHHGQPTAEDDMPHNMHGGHTQHEPDINADYDHHHQQQQQHFNNNNNVQHHSRRNDTASPTGSTRSSSNNNTTHRSVRFPKVGGNSNNSHNQHSSSNAESYNEGSGNHNSINNNNSNNKRINGGRRDRDNGGISTSRGHTSDGPIEPHPPIRQSRNNKKGKGASGGTSSKVGSNGGGRGHGTNSHANVHDNNAHAIDKDQQIYELTDVVSILEQKVERLEQLMQLKERKIQDLTRKCREHRIPL